MLNQEHCLSTIAGLNTLATHWIFSHDRYEYWIKETKPSVLFLHGKPGSGKSIAASAVVRAMQAFSTGGIKAVIYFFCNQQDERCRSAKQLLSSLIRQLLLQQPSFFRYIQNTFPFTSAQANWTTEELWVIFRRMLCSRDQIEIVCIINGIDQCDSTYMEIWNEFGKALIQATVTQAPLKFLISSQQPLGTFLSEAQSFNIDLGVGERVKDMVSDLVSTKVRGLVEGRPGFRGFEKKIGGVLLENQDIAVFSASIAIREIATLKVHSTPFAIQNMLDSASFSLPKVYQRCLENIPSHLRDWAHEALSWTLYPVRPLSPNELAVALAITSKTKSFSEIQHYISKDIIQDLKQTLDLFFSFENDEILLANWATREFLTSQITLDDFNPEKAHARITRICLIYLSAIRITDISGLIDNDGNVIIPQPEWALIAYAAQYWPTHYRKAGSAVTELEQEVLAFLTTQIISQIWPKLYWRLLRPNVTMSWKSVLEIASELGLSEVVMNILRSTSSEVDRAMALSWAAEGGHDSLVEQILKATINPKETIKDTGSLCQAAECGNESMVKLLLRFGYDINEKIGPSSPLALAAKNGFVGIVSLFLRNYMDDIPESSKSAALHLSAEHGHDLVVIALVKGGVSTNIRLEDGPHAYFPLHSAAKGGHVAVVRKLLDNGAEVEPESPELWPLHLAARNGHLNVVQQLIVAGANVDIRNSHAYTALHHAVEKGYTSIVQLLLNSEADPDASDDRSRTPLYISAEEGNYTVVQLLLEAGADIETSGVSRNTPLHAASMVGHQDVVQRLLDEEANTESINNLKETPLHLAAANGHVPVMKLLLEAGADVAARRYDGWTPLHLGAANEQLDSIRPLLEFGANVGARNNRGSTALVLASQKGNKGIVKLLLDRGSDAQHKINNGSTSLHRAAQCGHLEVVELLVEAGASPMAKKANDGMTAIDLAQANGHVDVVEFLNRYQAEYPFKVAKEGETPEKLRKILGDGVNVNIRDSEGCTMIFFTCGFGYEEATKVLLEAGADPEAQDNYGRSPLDVAMRDSIRLLLLNRIQPLVDEDSEPNLKIDTHDKRPKCESGRTLARAWCSRCNKEIQAPNTTVFFYRMNSNNTQIA